jgi:predicted MPP superfamily phosphohydrolase
MVYSQMVLGLSGIPFFSFLFGVTIGKYYYRVRRSTLYFNDLPPEFDNFTIAQISDIHAGSFDNPKAVQRGIELINAQKPDLFVFTGDLVNNKATEIVPYLDIFKQVNADYGKFSILGNHDYGDYTGWASPEAKRLNLEALKQYHGKMGYRLLLDEHVHIKKGSAHISLMGVENWGKGFGERGDLQKAIRGVNPKDFKILLSHDPTHWDAQVKDNPVKIHLTFSGHTHGMQFGIEIGKFKWSPAKYRYQNWAGLAESNGRYLYVNRGFGFIGFAGRVGIWPEITIIQIKRTAKS